MKNHMGMKQSDWLWTFVIYFGADLSSDQNFMLGHPTKNDCSTEVLLDFCQGSINTHRV
jgi:hypothetical protein